MQHVSKLTNLGTLLGGLQAGALRCMHTGALRVCLKKGKHIFGQIFLHGCLLEF
jgi:hypothetical protein